MQPPEQNQPDGIRNSHIQHILQLIKKSREKSCQVILILSGRGSIKGDTIGHAPEKRLLFINLVRE